MEVVKERGENGKKNGFFCCRAESEGRHAAERIKQVRIPMMKSRGILYPPKVDIYPLSYPNSTQWCPCGRCPHGILFLTVE